MLAAISGARLGAQSGSNADVKAAFLFNFAKFVEWPAVALASGQPLILGVYGNDAIADSLVRVAAGKVVGGHAVQIHRVVTLDEPAMVHMLFIDNSARLRVNDILQGLGKASVLTVSDGPRFLSAGGVIQLRIEDDRVRFDVDLQRAHDARLVVNSKLLALAGVVNPSKPH